MKVMQIRKKSGKMRTICVPEHKLKVELRSIGATLEQKVRTLSPGNTIHGFVRGRSPVTNALEHVGYQYTLCMDLQDFFDSIVPHNVAKVLSKEEIAQTFIDPNDGRGARPLQGLPSSPAVANLAALTLDKGILREIKKSGHEIKFTRYADDLTFSFNDRSIRLWLLSVIPHLISKNGFSISKGKTRFMPASAGVRHITGVGVTNSGIVPTRAAKRRLRAATHQKKQNSIRGLNEWCSLKTPNLEKKNNANHIKVATILSKHWDLRKKLPTVANRVQPNITDGDFIITDDPAYILGMSTYTTGWGSCMSHPHGGLRKKVVGWLPISGTSVAAMLSATTMTHGGIERRVMRSRCLVHQFTDGTKAYDRVYGDADSSEQLINWLTDNGYIPTRDVPFGTRVVGTIWGSTQPYLDTLKKVRVEINGKIRTCITR